MVDKKEISLDEILELYKGKGGNPESESVLVDSNLDKKAGFVSVWSNKNDAAKIISRCRDSIVFFEMVGDGVQLHIDRKAFRGMVYCFRNTTKKRSRKTK